MILPAVGSVHQYRALYRQDSVWLPAAREIAGRHGLNPETRRLTPGTHVVYTAGEVVIKLFCPLWRDDFQSEVGALESVQGLPTPRILGRGELEGWPYLLLSEIAGVPAGDVWAQLSLGARRSLVREIGLMLRRLHDQDLPENLDHDWDSFIATRLKEADSHHGAVGPWKRWIQSLLADFVEPVLQPVFLHADLTADHFYLTQDDCGDWVVAGIIDFGDARIGHPFYDFVAIIADYTFGEPELSRALMLAYGLDLTQDTAQDLVRYCLLHEFASLEGFRGEHPMDQPSDFFRAIWGTLA